MTTGRRLIKNSLTMFVCQGVMLLLSTVFIVYLARLLGPAEYGKYVFASNFPMIFFVILNFLHELSVRDVARDKSRASDYLGNSLSLKVFLLPVLFFAIFVSIKLMGYPQDTAIAVYVLSLYFFLQQLSTSVAAIFSANEKLGYFAISAAIEKVIIVALALYMLFTGGTLTTFVWAFVIGGIVRFVGLSGFVRRYAKFGFKVDLSLYKYFFKTGYPILISAFILILLSKIGIIFLSKIKGDAPVGLYGIGYSVYVAMAIVATSFSGAVFPVFSKYVHREKQKAVSLYQISFRLLFAVAALVMVVAWALADRLILLFFKEAYIESARVIKIIFLSLPLFFVRNLLFTILFSLNRQRQGMICLGISFIFSLVSCVILIPRLSYIGASLALFITEVVIFLTMFYIISRYFYKLNLLEILFKVAIAGTATHLFLLYLKGFNLFLLISGSTVLFAGILFFTGFVSKEHIKEIRKSVFQVT